MEERRRMERVEAPAQRRRSARQYCLPSRGVWQEKGGATAKRAHWCVGGCQGGRQSVVLRGGRFARALVAVAYCPRRGAGGFVWRALREGQQAPLIPDGAVASCSSRAHPRPPPPPGRPRDRVPPGPARASSPAVRGTAATGERQRARRECDRDAIYNPLSLIGTPRFRRFARDVPFVPEQQEQKNDGQVSLGR